MYICIYNVPIKYVFMWLSKANYLVVIGSEMGQLYCIITDSMLLNTMARNYMNKSQPFKCKRKIRPSSKIRNNKEKYSVFDPLYYTFI